MKRQLRTARCVTVVLVLAMGAVAACKRPQQSNWRSPSPAPTACGSDADCPGSSCSIEMGASQGSCAPVEAAPLHGGDGGAGPRLGPDVKPSASDIQI
jgi:hypothetical protein